MAGETSVMAPSAKWFGLALGLLFGWVIYLLGPVLAPFLTAAALAYLADPLVHRLQAWRLTRTQAVTLVFAGMLAVLVSTLLVLIPLLQHQLVTFAARMPLFVDWVEVRVLPLVQQTLGVAPEAFDLPALKGYLANNWQDAGNAAARVFSGVSRSGLTLLGWVGNLLLVPIVTFYLLRDWRGLLARIHELVPRHVEPEVTRLAHAADAVLGAFMRGQLAVMLALGLIYSLGLAIVGLDLAVLVGMLAGVLSFVPYLGFAVGLVAAAVAAIVQFHEAMPLLYVLGVFGIGQLLEGMVLTPWLLGDRIGLHPVAVIFAVLAGGQLFGFVGVLLALPAAAVTMVLLRYAHERYLQSPLYGPPPTGD
jgi:predicted PurR-regulated permease PerM